VRKLRCSRQRLSPYIQRYRLFTLTSTRLRNCSAHETQTAAKLAAHLLSLGYEVTEHVGGTGMVTILRNGSRPTVMLRSELDALPVEEKTGLAYASKVHVKDGAGRDVPVMHAPPHSSAVGHGDHHGAHSKESWHGVLMLVGQPAEETLGAAKGMIADGLFKCFPRPDVAVARYVGNLLPAGKVGNHARDL
jgi:metal-dependent amidase/aminoacylase/carboxypeptidase family protein